MCRSRCRCKSAHVSTTRCAKAENNDATRMHRDAPRLCSSRTGSSTLPESYPMASWSRRSAQEVRQRAARCCSPNPFSSHTSALPYMYCSIAACDSLAVARSCELRARCRFASYAPSTYTNVPLYVAALAAEYSEQTKTNLFRFYKSTWVGGGC